MVAPIDAVTLNARDGRRVPTARAEREAALMTDSVMRRHEGETLRVGFAIACRTPRRGGRSPSPSRTSLRNRTLPESHGR